MVRLRERVEVSRAFVLATVALALAQVWLHPLLELLAAGLLAYDVLLSLLGPRCRP